MPSHVFGNIEISYIDEATVEKNIRTGKHASDPAVANLERSDLTVHIYEGGFKVWECSFDLCEYLAKNFPSLEGMSVFELGCGAGLPGILSIKLGAKAVHFQDFNACVLNCFTEQNLYANGINESLVGRPNENSGPYTLLVANWEEMARTHTRETLGSFDLVLTSETIYNENDYVDLHDTLCNLLNETGICLLAAKFFYFGVSGSVPDFIKFVEQRNQLSVEEVYSVEASIPRKILKLRRRH